MDIRLHDLHHACLRVLDLDEATARWSVQFGLEVVAREPEAPRKIDPRIHPDLETIALRCLEKERLRRYASAEELDADLRRFLEGEAIAARPVGRAGRLLQIGRAHV